MLVLATAGIVGAETPAGTPAAKPADAKPAAAKPAGAPADGKTKNAQGGGDGGLLGLGGPKSKEPITITAEKLEYEYKDGIVTYRGDVVAIQGDVQVKSNELRITLAKSDDAKPSATQAADDLDDASASKLQSAVATGNVRIDQGTRWAVGGRATFDQTNRTLVLTENPVLHDGPNVVAGDKVVVFLDKDTAVVEGGRNKRVKGYFVPQKGNENPAGATAGGTKPGAPTAGAAKAGGAVAATPPTTTKPAEAAR